MTTSSKGVKAAIAGAAAILLASGLLAAQGASAARIGGEPGSLPQAFLLKLDTASTVRTFHLNRDDGLAAAKSAARSQKSTIGRAQAEVVGDLPADADVLYRTHSLLAGIGVSASSGDQTLLERIPGVSAVYPIAPKAATNAYAVPFQSAPIAWQATGYLGQGQTIAVIDSGIDYTHSDFGGPGTVAAYDAAHATEDQAADPSLFPNDKVVGGIDLVGDSYNTDPSDEDTYQPVPHPDPNPLDCGGHGSHVAGSAAGYGVNADGTTYEGAYDQSTDFGAMKIGPGMAPEADIYAIRVLGCDGSTDVVTEAIDRAVDPNNDGDPSDHVDVINMSLGADFGSVQDGDSVAANAASQMGVTVVAAAGNSGDHTDISGSPGDASRVLSVASTVDAESKIDGAHVTIDGTPESYGIVRSERYDWKTKPDLSGTVVAAPVSNEDACAAYPANTFHGEIVLVKWHDASPECPSITRGDNLSAGGAGGFIFGSDSETFSAGINGSDVIPGVLMAKSGTDAIRAALEEDKPVEVTGTELNVITQEFPDDNDKVSGFSSRGIHATGNVKPDVAAVGNTVFSVANGSGDDGVSFSGTSMASPMVAGLAALVRQANPGWSPLQVKADIMNTAGHDVYEEGSAEPSSHRYGPPRVGSGRIDAESALDNEVLAYDEEGGAVSVSFGPVAASGPITLTRDVTVDNQSASSVTYDASYDPINEVAGADITVSPSQVTLAAGATAVVTVKLQIDDPADLTKAVDPTVGRFGESGDPRETLAEAFGRLLLEPTGAGPTLRVPVYASPRPASVMTQPESIDFTPTPGDPGGQSASLELSGQGVENDGGNADPRDDIYSIAAGFELQATSGESPQCEDEDQINCWRLPEEQDADLSMVGFTSDAPYVDDPADALGYFALATHKPWAIPSDKVQFQIDLDVDRDGAPDLYVFNDRLGEDDIFVSLLVDPAKPAGQRVVDTQVVNGRLGDIDTALYDSDVMVLPVSLDVLSDYGINAANPRFNYAVEAYTGFSEQPIDMAGIDLETGDLDGSLSVNALEPAITATDDSGGPLVDDQPGDELTVNRDVSSYEADDGKGVMMVHFHNLVGAKAQTATVATVASSTKASVTSSTIRAAVSGAGQNLPDPTAGTVRFTVDGHVVGTAEVHDGSAVLQHTVRHGATHTVKANFLGNSVFGPSSGQVKRSDPTIRARLTSKGGKNRYGWYRKPVWVRFTCVAHGSPIGPCSSDKYFADDYARVTVRGYVEAADGGFGKTTAGPFKLDVTRPKVRIRGVRAGKAYRRVPKARCVARDRTSGVLRCRVTRKRHGNRVVITANAIDRAGNQTQKRVGIRLRR